MPYYDNYENDNQWADDRFNGGLYPPAKGGLYPQTEGGLYAASRPQISPPRQSGFSTGLNVASRALGAVNPALGIGLKALGGVASYLGGSYGRGVRKQGITGLRGMLGKPVFDPNAAFGFARRGTYNDTQQMGGQFDRNFGLDTGRGAGMYGKAVVDRLASQASGLYVDAEKSKADRDARIYELLASYQG